MSRCLSMACLQKHRCSSCESLLIVSRVCLFTGPMPEARFLDGVSMGRYDNPSLSSASEKLYSDGITLLLFSG